MISRVFPTGGMRRGGGESPPPTSQKFPHCTPPPPPPRKIPPSTLPPPNFYSPNPKVNSLLLFHFCFNFILFRHLGHASFDIN